MSEYSLPVSSEVLRGLQEQNSPLLGLASLSPADVTVALGQTWAGIEQPVFQRLADAILEVPVKCLSTWGEASYLTFLRWKDGPGGTFSIVAPRHDLPDSLRAIFPIHIVEGLETFLTWFGRLMDWPVGHYGNFLDPQDPIIVSNKDQYEWGNLGEWEGSLALYHGGSGDGILIRRDGVLGAWLHENAASDEPLCFELEYTFLELIDHFASYVRLPKDSKERKDSPFYY